MTPQELATQPCDLNPARVNGSLVSHPSVQNGTIPSVCADCPVVICTNCRPR